MLRVGLIGAGQAAEHHGTAFCGHPGAAVTVVADPDRARGTRLAERCGAQWESSAEQLLERPDVDAVVVCVPHDLHRAIALAALHRGVHVLLEKPIATTLADADAIARAAEETGVALMIGFVHRFRSEVLAARRLISEGAIGTPVLALDRFCAPGGEHPPAWVWERSRAGGGVLMYGGIHAIDRLLWLLEDEVCSAAAHAHFAFNETEVEDGLTALLRFRGGASAALVECSPRYGRPGGWTTEIFGTTGALRIQTGAWTELTSTAVSITVNADDARHFERQAAEFVAAIQEGRTASVTAADGRAALAVALEIYGAATSWDEAIGGTGAARES